jgi:hypothetical protein
MSAKEQGPARCSAGGVDHQAQLVALVFHGDVVAVDGAGEAALGRQGQLLHGRVLGGFVDAALQVVLVFQLAELGGHQAQDHGLALGQVAQRA